MKKEYIVASKRSFIGTTLGFINLVLAITIITLIMYNLIPSDIFAGFVIGLNIGVGLSTIINGKICYIAEVDSKTIKQEAKW